jgi:glyoxylase-like metal-dependent hydrolase (beta-lactamase superfamily II)
VFSRARYVVSEAAWERGCNPHVRDRASFIPELQGLLEDSGHLELIDGDRSATLGTGYRFHFSQGHTPGLMLTEVATPDGPLVFAGDLIPGVPWVHVPITMGYDRYPELLIDEKRALLEDLHGRGGRLFLTHDPDAAIVGIERDERGRFSAAL